jgi:hypothetical protein
MIQFHKGGETHTNRKTIIIGVLLFAAGLVLNYLLERHNIVKTWEGSDYAVSWADLFYPPLCVLLSLTGIVLMVGGAMGRAANRRLLLYAFAYVFPLTILYTLFAFGIQFMQTGADRLGECPGLYQAAASSSVIPESKWRPGRPALGCEVGRRGVFLIYYNSVGVRGVTDTSAQQRIIDKLAEFCRRTPTHPVQVMFYEEEHWTVRQGKNAATLGSGTPSKLVRVVNIV